jgi:hypothetical protein
VIDQIKAKLQAQSHQNWANEGKTNNDTSDELATRLQKT